MVDRPAPFGPPLPPFYGVQNEDDLVAVLLTAIMLDLDERSERAAQSYARGKVRATFRTLLPTRLGSFIDTEFVCIFRMKAAAMECLRQTLYPYLKPRLSEANIAGRMDGNRRVLSVDENFCLGLMYCGGVTMSGILWGFGIGKTAIRDNFWSFICAVIHSKVGEIRFPTTQAELQAAADAMLRNRCNHSLFYGCIGAGDGLGVRIKVPKLSETANPMAFMNR